jgi:hypothetical protein
VILKGFNSIKEVAFKVAEVLNLNRSLLFDGFNEKAEAANSTILDKDGTTAFSVSFRMRQNDTNNQMIISKQLPDPNYTGWAIVKDAGNIILLWRNDNSPSNQIVFTTNTTTMNTTQFYDIDVTYDGSKDISGLEVYIDGVLQAKTGTTNTLTGTLSSSAKFMLAARGTAIYANMYIHQVCVWDKKLSPAEVTERVNGGVPFDLRTHSAAANIEMYIPVTSNDDTTSVIYDISGNGYNLTPTAMEAGDLTTTV